VLPDLIAMNLFAPLANTFQLPVTGKLPDNQVDPLLEYLKAVPVVGVAEAEVPLPTQGGTVGLTERLVDLSF
jgi:hypothetical protein